MEFYYGNYYIHREVWKCYGKVMASSKGMKSGRDWKHYGKVTEILKT